MLKWSQLLLLRVKVYHYFTLSNGIFRFASLKEEEEYVRCEYCGF